MERYDRQLRLPGIGDDGQRRIASGKVLIVGMGGLGCPAALYLARAGVGTLTLCDFDEVHASDLHRQVLYTDEDLHGKKVQVAAARLEDQHGGLHVEVHDKPFESHMLGDADVVLDCTDEASTRALIHAACMASGTPLVWAAVEGWEAQWAVVVPGAGPCLRCLWPSPADAPSCEDAGILGPVVGIAGVWQALAALRILVAAPVEPGRLHLHDLRSDGHDVVAFEKRADCPTCAQVPASA